MDSHPAEIMRATPSVAAMPKLAVIDTVTTTHFADVTGGRRRAC
jgi:hypothetical protein